MIKDIVTYPTPPSVEYSTDVRIFDESLHQLITDLKDTIEANNLEGLAAYQIGNQFNVIVVKKDEEFLELVNPRVFNPQGKIESIETTAYFPGLTATITRAQSISVFFQDRDGKDCSLKANDDFAVLLQRKIDFTFGSSFINKLTKDEKKLFEKKLVFGSNIATPESCPIFSYKDTVNKITKVLFVVMFVLILVSLFIDDTNSLSTYQIILASTAFISTFIYIVVGYFEGKRYSSCTSCQIGNLIGTTFINWIKLSILSLVSYFTF